MNKNVGYIGAMLGMMAMCSQGLRNEPRQRRIVDLEPKAKPIPKGCKRYYFRMDNGYWYIKEADTVFECTATCSYNAIKKYDTWKSKQKS